MTKAHARPWNTNTNNACKKKTFFFFPTIFGVEETPPFEQNMFQAKSAVHTPSVERLDIYIFISIPFIILALLFSRSLPGSSASSSSSSNSESGVTCSGSSSSLPTTVRALTFIARTKFSFLFPLVHSRRIVPLALYAITRLFVQLNGSFVCVFYSPAGGQTSIMAKSQHTSTTYVSCVPVKALALVPCGGHAWAFCKSRVATYRWSCGTCS